MIMRKRNNAPLSSKKTNQRRTDDLDMQYLCAESKTCSNSSCAPRISDFRTTFEENQRGNKKTEQELYQKARVGAKRHSAPHTSRLW